MPDEGTVEVSTETTETVVDDSATTETVETVSETDPKVFDKEYVESLRGENASWRTKLRDKEKLFEEAMNKLKGLEDASLSVQEKMERDFEEAKTRASQFEAKAQENSLALQIALAAKDEKITDVKAAVKLADRELIEYDNNGQVTNLSTVLEHLKSEYSSLFASAPTASTGSSVNPSRPAKTKAYTHEDLKKMSPDRIMELKEKGDLNHLLGIR